MPIKNVLSIIAEGAGAHFDPNLVDTFLKISTDKIIKVFMSEANGKIEEEDLALLKSHNLYDIKNYSQNEERTQSEQEVLDLFNKYYLNIKEQEVPNA